MILLVAPIGVQNGCEKVQNESKLVQGSRGRFTYDQKCQQKFRKNLVTEQQNDEKITARNCVGPLIQLSLVFEHQQNQNVFLNQEHGVFHVGEHRISIAEVVEHHRCVAE